MGKKKKLYNYVVCTQDFQKKKNVTASKLVPINLNASCIQVSYNSMVA